ncbi:recombinase family protein [Faecalimonas sp.]
MSIFSVGIYIRLSREDGDKEESDSVVNQKKILTEYIKEEKEFTLYDIYIDDGFTGTNFNRPSFQRMLLDIESREVNCVIVKDLSRFGRDYIETGRYLEKIFPKYDVRFIAVTDHIDSFKREYDLLLPIKNIFNEQYARDISNKIQETIKIKQKTGQFIGAFASYGYKKSPINKNQLIVDPYAAEIVRQIFFMYIQGYGKQSIAKQLNEMEVDSPSEYKKKQGENYKNGNRLQSTCYWTYSTVNFILQNEMYIGNMVQGKKHQHMGNKQKVVEKDNWIRVMNTHEPIIDKEIWDKAQNLLKKRQKDVGLKKNTNIFAGFLQCGDCGRTMTKTYWKSASGNKKYFFCCGTYKRNGKKYCTPHWVPFEILENILLKDLKEILENVESLQELTSEQMKKEIKEQKRTENNSIAIKEELEKIEKLRQFVYEDYREGVLTKQECLIYREKYKKKKLFYEKQLELLKGREIEFKDKWEDELLKLKDIKELDREIIIEMVDKIIIYEDHRIKITYNFQT